MTNNLMVFITKFSQNSPDVPFSQTGSHINYFSNLIFNMTKNMHNIFNTKPVKLCKDTDHPPLQSFVSKIISQ